MLKLFGRATSINVQKVMWLLGEIGLAHERIDIGGAFGGLHEPAFLRLNPHGKIPVIDDGGVIVWESHSILRYLAAKYAPARFWPADPAARSEADRWMDWAQASMQPDFTGGVFWGFYRTPDHARDRAAIKASLARCGQHLRLLDRWLEGRAFLCGDALTLADIPAGVQLYRHYNIGVETPRAPNVEAWYARLCERPAYRNGVMIAFEELKGRLDY
jgi:glutathione S-transferase